MEPDILGSSRVSRLFPSAGEDRSFLCNILRQKGGYSLT